MCQAEKRLRWLMVLEQVGMTRRFRMLIGILCRNRRLCCLGGFSLGMRQITEDTHHSIRLQSSMILHKSYLDHTCIHCCYRWRCYRRYCPALSYVC